MLSSKDIILVHLHIHISSQCLFLSLFSHYIFTSSSFLFWVARYCSVNKTTIGLHEIRLLKGVRTVSECPLLPPYYDSLNPFRQIPSLASSSSLLMPSAAFPNTPSHVSSSLLFLLSFRPRSLALCLSVHAQHTCWYSLEEALTTL